MRRKDRTLVKTVGGPLSANLVKEDGISESLVDSSPYQSVSESGHLSAASASGLQSSSIEFGSLLKRREREGLGLAK